MMLSPFRGPDGTLPDDWRPREHYYRVEDTQSSSFSEDGDPTGHVFTTIRIRAIEVAHRTPKGVRLTDGHLVLHNPPFNKRWACPSPEEAVASYIARKKRQHDIHKAIADRAARCALVVERGRLLSPGLTLRPGELAKTIIL